MDHDEQYYINLYKYKPGKYLNTPDNIKKGFFYCNCFGFHYEDNTLDLKRKDCGDYQIMFTVYGSGYIMTCGQSYYLYPGSVIIVDCNRYHEYKTLGNCWCMYFFHCNGRQVPDILETIIGLKSRMFKPHNFEQIIYEFQKIYDIRKNDDINADILTSNWISNIFTMLLETPCADWYNNALSYINNNYTDSVTLEEIAEICHMNKSAFIRAFHKKSGLPPYKYILNLRIQLAKRLLGDFPGKTVTQIAAECGFESTSGFCQCFGNITGFTPTDYRRSRLPFVRNEC